jgi:hypothetical protein
MLSERCEEIEIDNVLYRCGKLKRTVLITYLATTPQSMETAHGSVPELTAFDCSHKHVCGVCAATGQWMSCQWECCVHPGLASQESATEPNPACPPAEGVDP